MSVIGTLYDFGKNKVGIALYGNKISRMSMRITAQMGEMGPESKTGVTLEKIVRNCIDSLFLGIPDLSGFVPPGPESEEMTFRDPWTVSSSMRVFHFTVIPVVDGALKVVYNAFAFVGNIFRALDYLLTGEGKKFVACLGFAGTNLVEIVRNTLRAIPIVGHGLAKIASLVEDIWGLYPLICKKSQFEFEAFNNFEQKNQTIPLGQVGQDRRKRVETKHLQDSICYCTVRV